MGFSLCFTVGITLHIVYAQNGTQYAPVVQSSDALLAAAVAIVGSVTSIIITLANRGLLGKHSEQIATNAVMVADTAHAVSDSRQSIKDGLQTTYDTIKISNPEAVAKADTEIAPVLDKMTVQVNEYKSKVDRFEDLANKTSNGGKKADPKIMDMKDDIPDRIVPS
jgi:hypothetical protein